MKESKAYMCVCVDGKMYSMKSIVLIFFI